jgi:hypothetical protein
LYPVRTGLAPEYSPSCFDLLWTNWAILVQTGFSTPPSKHMHVITYEGIIAYNCHWNSSFYDCLLVCNHMFQVAINIVEKEIFLCHPRAFREDPRKHILFQIHMLKSSRIVKIIRGPRCCN